VSGTIALHGGGEFQAGDEAFLAAWLRSARPDRPEPTSDAPLHVVVIPTAAARGRPELAAANGVAAIQRVAADLQLPCAVSTVAVLDRASAGDPALAARIARADAIHLPGGDPDLIPVVLTGTAAWGAITAAVGASAALAGASAGAMGLAAWTWTADGGTTGLGLLPGPPLVVMPHADDASWDRSLARFGSSVPAGLGILGLGERTGVLVDADPASSAPWRVVGEGQVRWSPAGADPARPRVFVAGETFQPGPA
jgi:cyanophycinase-like exopeptidase